MVALLLLWSDLFCRNGGLLSSAVFVGFGLVLIGPLAHRLWRLVTHGVAHHARSGHTMQFGWHSLPIRVQQSKDYSLKPFRGVGCSDRPA